MNEKQIKQLAGLFVIVPVMWAAGSQVIGMYEQWASLKARVKQLERWRCAMGGKPPETIDWRRSMEECRANWEVR